MSGNKSRLKTSFIPTLEFPPSSRYEMALTSLETYYSFPDLDASNNHLKVSLDDGKTWMDIHIPTGCYEIKAINNELQRFIMKKYGIRKMKIRTRCVVYWRFCMKSVESISMLMIVCAKFLDLTR